MPRRDIIVIGGSAGSLEPMSTIVNGLPHHFNATVFVVMHSSPTRESKLPNVLSRAGRLPAVMAQDKQRFEPGKIYVAPPDLHLMLENHHLNLVHGPKENRSRPALDPLFRSAALQYGARVIGVVLSGSLDDGTAGLRAIKKSGGVTIVQHPSEALYATMPQSAIENVSVDYVLPAAEIAPLLQTLAQHETVEDQGAEKVKEDLKTETEIINHELDSKEMIASVNKLGRLSMFTCPECHGTLWELNDGDFLRYRCHVGHAFSIESLDAEQAEKLEGALWSALRALEERVALASRLARDARERRRDLVAKTFDARAQEASKHVSALREILMADPDRMITTNRGRT